jgi:hypothetical protein
MRACHPTNSTATIEWANVSSGYKIRIIPNLL